MEAIYFLLFIGVCAFAVVWATRRPKAETNLAGKRATRKAKSPAELLTTPADNRLSHREEIWKLRRKQAKKGFSNNKKFVPKFEAAKEAEYDGYSRRDRHHLTVNEHVKEEAHIDEHKPSMTSIEFVSKEHASQT